MFRALFPCLIFAAMLFGGCSGSGSGGGGSATPAVPSPGPSASFTPGPAPATVVLQGSGYTLSFVLPSETTGSTSTITATLSTTLPSGVVAPSAVQHGTQQFTPSAVQHRTPQLIGANPTPVGLVYLTITSSAQVAFSSLPMFTFTLPSASVIPSGDPAYVLFYDGTLGWLTNQGPGVLSGSTVTFPGAAGGVTFRAGARYVFALAYTTQSIPTPSPAPLPTPTPKPTPPPVVTPTPSPTPMPTPTPGPTGVPGAVPVTIINNNSKIPSSSINIYIYGQDNTSGAWEYVTATGSTVAIPTQGNVVAPIPWSGTGTVSQTLYLPPLTSGRVYMYSGTPGTGAFVVGASGGGPSAPAPWAGTDGSKTAYYDFAEYTYNGSPLSFDIDTSQVDAFGLPLRLDLTGSTGTQTTGFLSGAVTQLANMLNTSGNTQWASLTAQMPYRVMNPGHGNAAGFFADTSFLDKPIKAAWNSYQNGNWMTMIGSQLSATGYGANAYGTVDSSGNFNWYTAPSTSSTFLGSIPSINTTGSVAQNESPTMEVLAANGIFVNVVNNVTYPKLMPKVGDYLVSAFIRGVLNQTTQPFCTGLYPGTAYQSLYSNLMHQIANNPLYGFGQAYSYAYDDSCGFSTNISDPSPKSVTITINNS